ncbi:MAG TPA: sulfotransferase, partial [Phycisphaerales bacterium]|nr:sulfotransferase [Phycisphaerales bacterium]
MTDLGPVFLTPMGRTGGTLFVTMLDAHPDLAMSYEIYEDRLMSDSGPALRLDWIILQLRAAGRAHTDQTECIRALPDKNLQTFMFRARRAGLDVPEILEEFELYALDAGELDSLDGRLNIIDRLMRRKMRKTGKRIWGGKARVNPRDLHRRHPNAKFFAMIRDGRDVLASMLKTGSFQTNPQRAAHEWTSHIRSFREFADSTGAQAMEISYERLVHHPH